MEVLCGLFGRHRQWYYRKIPVIYTEQQRSKLILEYVRFYRRLDPGMGGVKLRCILLEELGPDIVGGRDGFLALLGRNGLMLGRRKRFHTTDSTHPFHKYPNLVKNTEPTHCNEIWYADITYIWIEGDVLYLHLITDGYSHAVIGWCLSESLSAEYTAAALDNAIAGACGGNLCGTIHHSDRGSQYACHMYVGILMEHHIRISMSEDYKPTDNAVAERMNGILKTEWIYRIRQFRDKEEAGAEIRKMIRFYNYERPHMSIGMKIPMNVYRGEEPGMNLWKKTKKNL